MIQAQELWWRQARSDYELFRHLRRTKTHEYHLLHDLQMATEKLSKAYLWRSGHAPPKVHTGFVRFLRALADRRSERDRIAAIFGFRRPRDLETAFQDMLPLAYSLQNIAPAEAGDGPNPEYPWPHEAPTACPIGYTFALWNDLAKTRGRKLMTFVDRAIDRFPEYA